MPASTRFLASASQASTDIPTRRDSGAPSLPETGFVRQSLVLRFVPFSKSTLWRRVKTGAFPAPVKLSAGITAWRAEDVRSWIAGRS